MNILIFLLIVKTFCSSKFSEVINIITITMDAKLKLSQCKSTVIVILAIVLVCILRELLMRCTTYAILRTTTPFGHTI